MYVYLLVVLFISCGSAQHHQIQTNDVFMIPLSPASFNLTFPESAGLFSYKAALHKLPDLPKWIQLAYNPILKLGFLFGTPPPNLESVKLDIVAANQFTYESATKDVVLDVFQNPDPLNSQVKMKIHNLNVEDLMDEVKRNRLLDVFRDVLWPESTTDLHMVELQSALAAGGRRPMRRSDGEGVIVTVGSQFELSEMLRELEREVSPLWASRNCPRDFKKTSAERHFRSKGFLMDWCSFKLTPQNTSLLLVSTTTSPDFETRTERIIHKANPLDNGGIWRSPEKDEISMRSYTEDGIIAIFLPLILLLLLAAILTAILGVHPEGSEVEEGQLYEAAFEEINFLKPAKKEVVSSKSEAPSASAKTVPSEDSPKKSRSAAAPSPRESSLKSSQTNTPSLSRTGSRPRHQSINPSLYGQLTMDSVTRGSSPFIMSSASATPVSTLSRSAYRSGAPSERASTLGRRDPPPYSASLNRK